MNATLVGGPKLRKWYGAPDRLPKDGSILEEEDKYSGSLLQQLMNLRNIITPLYWFQAF